VTKEMDTIGQSEALRLVVTYRKKTGQVTLDKYKQVPMRLRSSVELPGAKEGVNVSGTWYELQTSRGRVLYRQVIQDPTKAYVEFPAEKDPSKIVRKEASINEKIFMLDVPKLSGGAKVVLFNVPSKRSENPRQWVIPIPKGSINGGAY
jgi:hypothetical protein